jgi:hypothetical protein
MQHYPEPVDQVPDDLRLTLIEGLFEPEQFCLFSRASMVLSGVQVEAAVIGASHIISLYIGDLKLHEMFACVGLPNVASWGLAELTQPVRQELSGMQYEFTSWLVDWSDPEPDELTRLVLAASHPDNSSFGLVQDFPSGDQLITPKTIIFGYADEDRKGVVIETAHSYPNVRGLVLSRTTLFREEGETP